jgi:hypothetical protein
LQLGEGSECLKAGRRLVIDLPDGCRWEQDKGSDVGAWQGSRLFQGPDYQRIV